MATQYSTTLRNAQLAAIATAIGVGGRLQIYTGPMPANCAASATGTKLADITLPNPFLGTPASGVVSLTGTWTDASADATGQPGYYRFVDSAGTTCHAQGLCSMPWAASTAFALGTAAVNDGGKVYIVTTAGTSAGSGGPTGTGGSITDGTVTWAYAGLAADALACGSAMVSGAAFSVTSFSFTAGNA